MNIDVSYGVLGRRRPRPGSWLQGSSGTVASSGTKLTSPYPISRRAQPGTPLPHQVLGMSWLARPLPSHLQRGLYRSGHALQGRTSSHPGRGCQVASCSESSCPSPSKHPLSAPMLPCLHLHVLESEGGIGCEISARSRPPLSPAASLLLILGRPLDAARAAI